MKRTAIVHIGLEKTGSTAIQRWFAAQHDQMLGHGIFIPQSIGFPNHTKLVAACLDDGAVDNIKAYQLFASGLSEKRYRERIFAALAREIRAEAAPWHTLLISSELISSRLSSATELQRLHDQIGRYVDAVKYVIFLRRQDQLALSRFSSILRSGHDQFDNVFVNYSPANFLSIPDGRLISDDLFFYDYRLILERFTGLADAELCVFPYGAVSPIQVMAELLKIEASEQTLQVGRHNSALSAEAQFILAQLNRDHVVQFPSGMRNDAYRRLQRRVESEMAGAGRQVERQAAHQFYLRYHAVNQQIADQYWNGQPLFKLDFSAYPESVDYAELPQKLSGVLAGYQDAAQALPTREPLSKLIKYSLKRFKATASALVASRFD